jgi:DNA-binding transcriptional ArsR family regulator
MKEGHMSLRDYERVMKTVADPTRVRILKLLENGEMCVCQVIAILEFSQSTISKHLFLLKMAELVKERKEGKWVHYSLNGSDGSPYAKKMIKALRGWLNDDPVIERDRKREAVARAVGPIKICERGMTLPRRSDTCCPPAGEGPVARE